MREVFKALIIIAGLTGAGMVIYCTFAPIPKD